MTNIAESLEYGLAVAKDTERIYARLVELHARRAQAYSLAFGTHWAVFWKRPESAKAKEQLLVVNRQERTLVGFMQREENTIRIPEGIPEDTQKFLRLGISYQTTMIELHQDFLAKEKYWIETGEGAGELLLANKKFLEHVEQFKRKLSPLMKENERIEERITRELMKPEVLQALHHNLPPDVFEHIKEFFSSRNRPHNMQFLGNLVAVFLLSDKIIMAADKTAGGILEGEFGFWALWTRFVLVGVLTNMAGLPTLMGSAENAWLAELKDSLHTTRIAIEKQ